jgi:hypothetical protein
VVNEEVISLGGISAPWLADQLDSQGVLLLREVFSEEWLKAMRDSVIDHIASHGDGDFLISQADREIGSPAHQLVSNPALRELFEETVRHRWPTVDSTQDIQCGIPIRAGTGRRAPSNLFHYDANALTMVVPIFIPRAAIGSCGELAAFGNKRPFRRFVGSHLVDLMLTYNPLYRRYVTKKVHDAPEKYIVALQPGDACVFWGYRTFHGNVVCAPGLLRATLVLQYGQLHSDSWTMKVAWRFSRSRRDSRRFQYRPGVPADFAHGISDELHA